MQERIQKILSARGICSRRKAEEYIEQGLITVNGSVAQLGDKADPNIDTIEVDGKVLQERSEMIYVLMNKPTGFVTSNVVNPHHSERTVRELLPKELQGVVYPVGRLDKDTSGLLLFTNDGVLAYRLTHPSFHHEKEYEVQSQYEVKDGQLAKLRQGITLDGVKTKPAVVKRVDQKTFRIALTEGKNRQIRRMCQKVGTPVKTLKRVRILSIQDSALPYGGVRELTEYEQHAILQETGITE